ncbi:MAG TPA: toprim domain-containing protein [Candidatus Paceibacterota bacterium]
MNNFEKLTELFKKFPGIGPRQAQRFVYFLLTRNKSYIDELQNLIKEVRKETSICKNCFRYFSHNGSKMPTCNICSNEGRESATIMIVSRDIDLENLEKAGNFKGKYFCLGGTLPILEKEPEKKIRINELLKKVETEGSQIKEIIIAMNTTMEGENTEDYLREQLNLAIEKFGFKITTLGKGLSTGAELEYADPETLQSALKNRQ